MGPFNLIILYFMHGIEAIDTSMEKFAQEDPVLFSSGSSQTLCNPCKGDPVLFKSKLTVNILASIYPFVMKVIKIIFIIIAVKLDMLLYGCKIYKQATIMGKT